MKILNKKSTSIFSKIVEMAKAESGYIKLNNSNDTFMPLSVEILETKDNITFVSLAHYYEQNGDLMADPEMCFAITNMTGETAVIPYYFKTDGVGREQTSVLFEGNNVRFNKRMQADHTSFANQWLLNIKRQQSIK